jgi:hypothetical protein
MLDKMKPPTRRGILSFTSSIYDPLGFLSPFILRARMILQELCRLKLGWDERIPEEQYVKWIKWVSDLEKVVSFRIDRCIKPEDFGPISDAHLHHFADASEKGYGTVTYIRLENKSGRVHCTLLLSKARVSPIKPVTMPRMELTAATVAVRVYKMLRDELDLPLAESYFWTDSTSVLKYIRNENSRFHTFVANNFGGHS